MDKKCLARLLITLASALPVVQAEELFPDYIDSRNARLSRCSFSELKAFIFNSCRKCGVVSGRLQEDRHYFFSQPQALAIFV